MYYSLSRFCNKGHIEFRRFFLFIVGKPSGIGTPQKDFPRLPFTLVLFEKNRKKGLLSCLPNG